MNITDIYIERQHQLQQQRPLTEAERITKIATLFLEAAQETFSPFIESLLQAMQQTAHDVIKGFHKLKDIMIAPVEFVENILIKSRYKTPKLDQRELIYRFKKNLV